MQIVISYLTGCEDVNAYYSVIISVYVIVTSLFLKK